ncbi:MAG: aldehyde dehydrogenase (NADP(+)) [Alphaproteobacteria bacterium]|nr:aldehyde dehydrogenase (NADP(+)) [Alphaproteobacteria bacterium]
MATPLTGAFFIGSKRVQSADRFYAVNPETSEKIEPGFSVSSEMDVEQACALANSVFDRYRATSAEERAQLLEAIAENVAALGETAIPRAQSETALPQARLTGELARTCNQLRLFAGELRDGRWQGVRIDPAQPDRTPLPRPDLRLRKIPVGPVAVFGASNFPFAFSVAGGDTAAALAAGCPVVVKAHPAHPGASELVAGAIIEAVKACGLPDGVFSMIAGPSNALGAALVANPHIKAVGFTGSRQGGLALMEIAARRAEPIPVYAEMSSINPVLLLPGALDRRAEALAEAFLNSLTMGVGQFCTNPGLLIAVQGPGLERFIKAAAAGIVHKPAATMLTPGIFANYTSGIARLRDDLHAQAVGAGPEGRGPNCGQAFLFSVSATDFLASPKWAQEVFGPSSVLVHCDNQQQMQAVLEALEGQLTATLQIDDADHALARNLLPILERKAGRILANGWPTGVEVAHAMVHGGPFPATSDGRSTSVGTLSIDRFLRPVCYQDLPSDLLPTVLRS